MQNIRRHQSLAVAIVAAAAAAVIANSAHSQSTWDTTVDGANWGDAANWDPSADYPDDVGTVVNFTNAIPGSRTVNLDVSPTAGVINIGGATPAGAFTLSGPGTLNLNNSGTAQINFLDGSAALNSIAGTISLPGDLTVNNNSDVEQRFASTFAVTTTGVGTRTMTNAGSGTGDVAIQSNAITTGAPDLEIVQNSGSSRLVMGIPGTSRTHTGGTTLLQGTLAAAGTSTSTKIFGTGTVTLSGGTLQNTSAGNLQFDNNVVINGNVNFTSEAGGSVRMINNAGTNTVDLAGAARTLTVTESLVVTARITNGGILKEGPGLLQVTGNNHDFAGGLTINEGSTTLLTASTTLSGGALTISNGATLTTSDLTAGLVTVNDGTILVSSDRTITSDVGFVVNSGSSAARFSGTGTFTKTGAGTFTMNNIIAPAGTKTIEEGMFLLNAQMNGGTASTITVEDGGTLGGTGLIFQPSTVIEAGGTLLGGDGTVGTTLTSLRAVTLEDDSILLFALGAGGASSSLARTGGTWTFAAAQSVSFIDLGAGLGEYSTLITGLASVVDVSGWTIANGGWEGSFFYDTGTIGVNLTAIPEPNTWAMVGFGLALVLLCRSSRRRRMNS